MIKVDPALWCPDPAIGKMCKAYANCPVKSFQNTKSGFGFYLEYDILGRSNGQLLRIMFRMIIQEIILSVERKGISCPYR